MQNVYEVKYESLVQDLPKKKRYWVKDNETIHVLANGSAKAAIKRAERHLLKRKTHWTDEGGEKRVEVTLEVVVTSCERVLSIDV
jgi:hypothetical protein